MKKKIQVTMGHICFEIAKLKKSMLFYNPLFDEIGFHLVMGGEEGYAGYSNDEFQIFLCESKPRRVSRKKPSGEEMVISDHIALLVASRKEVDSIAKAMDKAGFEPLFPPEEHPQFVKGYYAVSFNDPDNNVIEFYTVPK